MLYHRQASVDDDGTHESPNGLIPEPRLLTNMADAGWGGFHQINFGRSKKANALHPPPKNQSLNLTTVQVQIDSSWHIHHCETAVAYWKEIVGPCYGNHNIADC